MILPVLFLVIAGCEKQETESPGIPLGTDQERIQQVKQAVFDVRIVLDRCPRWDLLMRATREFIILRQVELYDKSTDEKTRNDMDEARSRADAVLRQLAHFAPWLEQLREKLLFLRGALHYAANLLARNPEWRAEIWKCRSRVSELLDDVDVALRVFVETESVFPGEADFFDPDFMGVLSDVEAALGRVGREGL